MDFTVFNADQEELEHHSFEADKVTIGRSIENDVVLYDRSVSRRHVVLEARNGGVLVRNLSNHGVFVNGTRTTGTTPARPGDFVQIGTFLIRLERSDHGRRRRQGPPNEGEASSAAASMPRGGPSDGGWNHPASHLPESEGFPEKTRKSTLRGDQLVVEPPPLNAAGSAPRHPRGNGLPATPPQASSQVESLLRPDPGLQKAPPLSASAFAPSTGTEAGMADAPGRRTASSHVDTSARAPHRMEAVRPPEAFALDGTKAEPSPSHPESPVSPGAVPQQTPAPGERRAHPGHQPAAPDYSGPPLPFDLKKRLHSALLDYLSLKAVDLKSVRDEGMHARARAALEEILERRKDEVPPDIDRAQLIKEILDEALGLGPIQDLLYDESISEIMVVQKDLIFVERNGRLERSNRIFSSDEAVMSVIERIVTPLGRRIDESTPLVDARLKDGSRVNAIIHPLALKGPTITIRKFATHPLQLDDLVGFGTLTAQMGRFLARSVKGRRSILISGGTGSGKTTLLNVLSSFIDDKERIVTIEDAAELQLQQSHVVPLETRPPNIEGKGAYTIRDLVKNALRMRPDRIIVGECRGAEALDMLQAMNTGHEGSMTTGHANNPEDMLARLETMVLMAGLELPLSAVRRQIAAAIDLVVHQERFSDGTRRVTHISELVEVDEDGVLRMEDIFRFKQVGIKANGDIVGEFMTTGYLPGFIDKLVIAGLIDGNEYL